MNVVCKCFGLYTDTVHIVDKNDNRNVDLPEEHLTSRPSFIDRKAGSEHAFQHCITNTNVEREVVSLIRLM